MEYVSRLKSEIRAISAELGTIDDAFDMALAEWRRDHLVLELRRAMAELDA